MRTILIADRDVTIVQRLREALEAAGYHVVTAHDGEQARALIMSAEPDLLILDADTDGFGILEELGGQGHRLPVIMMGANIPGAKVFRGWQLGVDSYQSKNVRALASLRLELRAKIERILGCVEGPGRIDRAPEAP